LPTPPHPLRTDAGFLADVRGGKMTQEELRVKYKVSAGFIHSVKRDIPLSNTNPSASEETSIVSKSNLQSESSTSSDGTVSMTKIAERIIPLSEWLDDLRNDGHDPEDFVTSHGHSVYMQHTRAGATKVLYANKFSATKRKKAATLEATYSLANLYAQAGKEPRSRTIAPSEVLGTVIVVADWQIGKHGRRGGTPELLERLAAARAAVADELERRRPGRILILDGGDGIEGFESGGDPAFTNDLSLPDQLDCYGTELYKFVELANGFAPVEVGAVPSNHAAWRRGKQNLGKPSDDFGLFVHRQVGKVTAAAGIDAEWSFPSDYDESLCVDFCGTPIGIVHGNQFAPGKAIDWWQAQAFGDQAVSRADVMVSAHYHSFGAGVAGQNPFTKRERMWLGAPTLDSGSDWYRNIKGRDSLPGTMIFNVTERGFDLSSLTIV
jgi:hypothetical protein